jgi:hypothetical protein
VRSTSELSWRPWHPGGICSPNDLIHYTDKLTWQATRSHNAVTHPLEDRPILLSCSNLSQSTLLPKLDLPKEKATFSFFLARSPQPKSLPNSLFSTKLLTPGARPCLNPPSNTSSHPGVFYTSVQSYFPRSFSTTASALIPYNLDPICWKMHCQAASTASVFTLQTAWNLPTLKFREGDSRAQIQVNHQSTSSR